MFVPTAAKPILASALLALSCAIRPAPAVAGSWSVAYSTSFTTTNYATGATQSGIVAQNYIGPNQVMANNWQNGHMGTVATITATCTYTPDPNNPRDTTPFTATFHEQPRAVWNGPSAYCSGSANDGLYDAYIVTADSYGNGTGSSGDSHLDRQISTSAQGVVTISVTESVDLTVAAPSSGGGAVAYYTLSYQVCPLRIDPLLPSELTTPDSNENINFFHGTDYQTALILIDPSTIIDNRGTADFGKGFYTVGNSGNGDPLAALATRAFRNWQEQNPNYVGTNGPAAIEFSIPHAVWYEYICDHWAQVLGFTSTDPSASPPWNSPAFPGDQPDPTSGILIPPGALNWINMGWYDWYCMRCKTPAAPADPYDDTNYVPTWSDYGPQQVPDWNMAFTWGRFYQPKKAYTDSNGNCATPRGFEVGAPLAGVNQYVFGSDSGVGSSGLLNETDDNGNLVVSRKIFWVAS